jgi:glycolate dehydrogenase FAD-binding subunit
MAVSSPALREALADIVGSGYLIDAARALDAHAVDGVRPRWIARPGNADEVSRMLAFAHAERLAVSPRGSGSAVLLGNSPRRLDLVVDLARLREVSDYVPEDMVASVEAGLSLAALGRSLAERNQMVALDPLGGSSRSIGGILATNASGPLRFRYGTARDLTLGVRFVQADGTITWGGAKVVKSVTGYDVPKLMVGSLGTLGIIVSATLRLHPLPPARGSWLFAWKAREAVESFLAAVMASSLEPDRLTLLNGDASRGYGCSGEKLALLVSIGSVDKAVSSQGHAMCELAGTHGAETQELPVSCWERLQALLTGDVWLRVSSEPRRVVFWLGELERLASGLGLRVSAVAQAGNGMMQAGLQGEVSGAALDGNLLRPLREGLASEGGSLVVERAPSSLKAHFDVWGAINPDSLAIMSRLKAQFDPEEILNPGRFVGGL